MSRLYLAPDHISSTAALLLPVLNILVLYVGQVAYPADLCLALGDTIRLLHS